MDDRLERFLRSTLREAGKRVEEQRNAASDQLSEARDAYRNARDAALVDLPTDDEGRAKIVCRRYVERRAARLDPEGRPACFDADHPDCQGCAEDVRAGRVETW
ncbi:DUF7091 family protein [Halomicrococcus gelatinilyticus]|uniref:DUF7091 family protein n=1 Tax=Halomicrococcus gelatinilyticus TaxID=1702103 RepID=UPI002E14780C